MLNQIDREKHSSITSKKVEAIIKSLMDQRFRGEYMAKFYQIFKEELILIPYYI